MITIRTISLVTAALALSGCAAQSSYSGLVARSHADYERAVLSGNRTAVSGGRAVLSEEGEVRPEERAKPRRTYASKRPRPVAAAAERESPGDSATTGGALAGTPARARDLNQGDLHLTNAPSATITDATESEEGDPLESPAWQRENAKWERMEKDLKRKLRGICTGC
jgi:hypothetical protein